MRTCPRVALALAACAALAACGRIGFAPLGPGGDAAGDGTGAGDSASSGACDHIGPGILFCDGFEDPALNAWPSRDGTESRVTDRVHSGTGALLATSPDSSVSSAVEASPYGALTTGSIHYRGWFYLPSGFALTKLELLGADGASGQGVVALVDMGELRLYSAPLPAITVTSGVQAPRDRWFCLEVHVEISATNGQVALDLDGAQIGIRSGVDTLASGGYTTLSAGALYLGPGQAAVSVYVDDIETGSVPVGCL